MAAAVMNKSPPIGGCARGVSLTKSVPFRKLKTERTKIASAITGSWNALGAVPFYPNESKADVKVVPIRDELVVGPPPPPPEDNKYHGYCLIVPEHYEYTDEELGNVDLTYYRRWCAEAKQRALLRTYNSLRSRGFSEEEAQVMVSEGYGKYLEYKLKEQFSIQKKAMAPAANDTGYGEKQVVTSDGVIPFNEWNDSKVLSEDPRVSEPTGNATPMYLSGLVGYGYTPSKDYGLIQKLAMQLPIVRATDNSEDQLDISAFEMPRVYSTEEIADEAFDLFVKSEVFKKYMASDYVEIGHTLRNDIAGYVRDVIIDHVTYENVFRYGDQSVLLMAARDIIEDKLKGIKKSQLLAKRSHLSKQERLLYLEAFSIISHSLPQLKGDTDSEYKMMKCVQIIKGCNTQDEFNQARVLALPVYSALFFDTAAASLQSVVKTLKCSTLAKCPDCKTRAFYKKEQARYSKWLYKTYPLNKGGGDQQYWLDRWFDSASEDTNFKAWLRNEAALSLKSPLATGLSAKPTYGGDTPKYDILDDLVLGYRLVVQDIKDTFSSIGAWLNKPLFHKPEKIEPTLPPITPEESKVMQAVIDQTFDSIRVERMKIDMDSFTLKTMQLIQEEVKLLPNRWTLELERLTVGKDDRGLLYTGWGFAYPSKEVWTPAAA